MPIYSTGKSVILFLKSSMCRKFIYIYIYIHTHNKLDNDHLINQTNGLWNTKFKVHELSSSCIMTTYNEEANPHLIEFPHGR